MKPNFIIFKEPKEPNISLVVVRLRLLGLIKGSVDTGPVLIAGPTPLVPWSDRVVRGI